MPRLPRAVLIPILLARFVASATIAGLLWFCVVRAPRGFEPLSRHFFEQEVLLPAFALLATAPLAALVARVKQPFRLRLAFWGALTPPAVAIACFGSTEYAHYFVAGTALGFLLFWVSEPRFKYKRTQRELTSFGFGLPIGVGFLAATHAPPATTHPRSAGMTAPAWDRALESGEPEVELVSPFGQIRFEASATSPGALVVEISGERVDIEPAFELTSYSPSCLWSIVDYRRESLPPFRVARLDERSLLLKSEGALLATFVRARVDQQGVLVETVTHVRSEVCVHLAHALVMTFSTPSVQIAGRAWAIGEPSSPALGMAPALSSRAPPREFLAFRNGKLELLRAAQDEKGPFSTLLRLPDRDPVFSTPRVDVEIAGFVEQAAREASPTAGYGVSQGAIEAGGRTVWVELAATSVGRGWDTVRIAPGTYELDVRVRGIGPH